MLITNARGRAILPGRIPPILNYHAGDDLIAFGITATRSGNAWQRNSAGVWKLVATNVWRDNHYPLVSNYAGRQFIGEPAATNLCKRNCLYGTNGTSAWTLSGVSDPAAVFSAVDDAAELTAAGLYDPASGAAGGLTGDTYCLKLDNSGGVIDSQATVAVSGLTNPSAISVFVRGGSGYIGLDSDVGKKTFGASAHYSRVSSRAIAATGAATAFRLHADPGQIVYFVLSQCEATAAETTPIPNSTSGSVSRAADKWTISPWGYLPGSVSLYGRFVFMPPYASTGVLAIGQNGANQGIGLTFNAVVGPKYQSQLRMSTSGLQSDGGAPTATIGDDVRAALRADITGRIATEQSVNRALSTMTTPTVGQPYDPAFSATIVTVGNWNNGAFAAPLVGSHLVIDTGVARTLDQLEAL